MICKSENKAEKKENKTKSENPQSHSAFQSYFKSGKNFDLKSKTISFHFAFVALQNANTQRLNNSLE